ncbi:PQQ-dependent sugar dehydrogenase [Paraburkholderia phymatum]|uniref:L-sorbosone dehydrogenase n=1 Tax=Paraburkholderia phymatum (strain DSM 17167 / CIP 108236 / LMG 21445 / STM815) TaxID=391038 RepID=B2JK82_PARP8|nr:PQQ-dependent sugar dehydrogenase [Paraburkholderia phymatum]ACC70805.1 L-sorbosone dehydrogenase [Paraburkholderia phymatum STM815]
MNAFLKRVPLAVSAALAMFSAAQAAQDNVQTLSSLKTTRNSKPAQTVPQTGARADALRENLRAIKLPPGFRIELYAVVPEARAMAVAPSTGVVFVGTRGDRVWRVTDRTRRRVADEVVQFASSVAFKVPNAVCFSPDGVLYVVEQNRVLAFPAAQYLGEGGRDVAANVVVPQGKLIPTQFESLSHGAHYCRVGPDQKLYIALGQPWNVPPKYKLAELDRNGLAGIIRLDRNGKNREVFSHGVRNSVGLDFNPKDKTLWFTDNQVDGMGDDIPPGELNHATRAGANYGFPWYGGGKVRTQEYRNETPPAGVVFPAVEYAAHAADLGMSFYTGTMFPQKYRGGIFDAEHGSWNRTKPIGARVMFTAVKDDGSVGETEVFAEGWLTPTGEYTGRPVDVQQLQDGSLLVSDDYAGAVYRISYAK